MLIVEATFVYPIMFFVIFFLFYMGNMYYLRSRIDTMVNMEAIKGAAYFADNMLDDMYKGSIPTVNTIDIQPYRYLNPRHDPGLKNDELKENIENTGFFAGMRPQSVQIKRKANNYIIYQTYEIEVSYVLSPPMRFLFQDDFFQIDVSSHAEIPVTDTAEFIRNTDMVVDYLQRTEVGQDIIQGIEDIIKKVDEIINTPE